ncbi:MAG: hypothetical protein EZS28_028387 [Streblomastix strix]|uniref:Uncharacterized protein n=1 Tax=Streblomastix strix TaxID=222440 RepID=A0A5J4V034_9EUKA|nr:MAG: hypothetical protein EZS28_028387 [Streblomastix strix]
MVYSLVEHIEYAELFRSSFCRYVHGIVLAKSLSEIFAIYRYSNIRLQRLRYVISGWSDGKIRSFGPESGRIQHVTGDVYKKVSSVSTSQNSPAIASGVSEGQVCLCKLNRDNQQIVATRKDPSPSETLASPLYFEIAKWAAGTGCSVELPIPMGRPFEKQESEP